MKKRRRKQKRRVRRRRLTGKPIIGITCEVHKLKPYFSEFELMCDYRYVRAIIRAGGIPVLVPINPLRRDSARLLDHLNGLVFIGGADIPPTFYGEKTKKKVAPMYRGRTYFEMWLYRAAQRKGIPILAICYGMQLLNVIYGGKLYQDMSTQVKGIRNHVSKRNPMERVYLQEDSLYYKIFKKKTMMVHCQHHQAVKVPGKSLRITAYADDGMPEALEGPPRTFAVQWHPERQEKDPVQQRLFRHFIALARTGVRPRRV